MKIDVVLEPSEIRRLSVRDLSQTTCVVFDVLRATSSMLTGLASGVECLVPVTTIEEALEQKRLKPDALLGGERFGERIEGFDVGNSPFEYQGCSGRRIITTTTNGTVALRACERAAKVWVGAVLNLEALIQRIRTEDPTELLLVCAGTFEALALEDVWAAGRLLELLGAGERLEYTDAARVAFATAKAWPKALDALMASRNGGALLKKGRRSEVAWCSEESRISVVGEMSLGEVRSTILF